MERTESIELKLREIDNPEFAINYTKKIVGVLHEPQMSLEVKEGKVSEDVSKLVESLGYEITAKREMDGWNRITAVKSGK